MGPHREVLNHLVSSLMAQGPGHTAPIFSEDTNGIVEAFREMGAWTAISLLFPEQSPN